MLTPRSLGAQSSKTRPVQFIHICSRHDVLVLKAAKQGQFSLYTNSHATKVWCSKQQNKASSGYTQMLTPRSLGAQSSKTRPVQFIHKCLYTALLVEKSVTLKYCGDHQVTNSTQQTAHFCSICIEVNNSAVNSRHISQSQVLLKVL